MKTMAQKRHREDPTGYPETISLLPRRLQRHLRRQSWYFLDTQHAKAAVKLRHQARRAHARKARARRKNPRR